MQIMRTFAFPLVVTAGLLAACGPVAEVGGGANVDNDGALDVTSVLGFLNGPDATFVVLTNDAHVQARAANNILSHVRGADGVLGTGDDDLLGSLAELDAVPQVGPATIEAIAAYVRARYQHTDLSVEGVDLSADAATQIVALCNTATAALLDDDVGLDTRAVNALIAGRPLADIHAVAAASYVGTTAIARLRDYVIAHPGTPTPTPTPTPVDTHPATIVSAVATDAEHLVVTFSKALDPHTGPAHFSCFIDEPDAPFLCDVEDIIGREVFINTDPQDVGTEYTLEAADTLKDVDGNTVTDRWARWMAFDGGTPPPPPAGVDCAALHGGTFDGTAFTAAQECQAVKFLRAARFSEMGALAEAGRRVAYDCSPTGSCGFRTSAWARLSQFSDFTGVGTTSLSSLKTAMAGWTQNGLPYDTVAHTWQTRTALVDQPINLDNVFVSRRLADQMAGTMRLLCIEVRDSSGAPNFLAACLQGIGADTSPECNSNGGSCLDAVVGTSVSLRGRLRTGSGAPGGYRVVMTEVGPRPANPNAH